VRLKFERLKFFSSFYLLENRKIGRQNVDYAEATPPIRNECKIHDNLSIVRKDLFLTREKLPLFRTYQAVYYFAIKDRLTIKIFRKLLTRERSVPSRILYFAKRLLFFATNYFSSCEHPEITYCLLALIDSSLMLYKENN
jgi:hypothetical protein